MPRINKPQGFRVDIIESERGWGSKIDEVIYFDNPKEAQDFANEYNAKYNTEEVAPDWYMVASYAGEVK